MSNKRYLEEFKLEAVKQITEQGYPTSVVSTRLGVSKPSLYDWVKEYSQPTAIRIESPAWPTLQSTLRDYPQSLAAAVQYNGRRHGYNNSLSPVEFERQFFSRLESV